MSAWQHPPYTAMTNLAGGMRITRRDPDGHSRTVCFIDCLRHWDRFCAAIDAGASEVDAVHAIDSQ